MNERRPGPAGGLDQHRVEPLPRKARVLPPKGHVNPVRGIDPELAAVPRLSLDIGSDTEHRERVQRIADQAVAADLVARKGPLIDDDHPVTSGGKHPCRSRSRGPCSDDQHVRTGRR